MTQSNDEIFMQRAMQLAKLGQGKVAPNPMVGCVIVHDNQIIGEGWHRQYGGSHAEVHAVNTVANQSLLPLSTVYVTLEPCSHFGKTPPCADLLIEKKVKKVVIANIDSNPLVAGKGIEKLKNAGIEVESGILATTGQQLNRRFFTPLAKKRPYIILKWAQTTDGFIADANSKPLKISNIYTSKLVHKWRGQEQSILIGTQTAQNDDPQLSTRLWQGPSPIRLVLDRYLRLPKHLKIFTDGQPTYLFHTTAKPSEEDNFGTLASMTKNFGETATAVHYVQLEDQDNFIEQVIFHLYDMGIQSVLVEGGAQLLNLLMQKKLWDEARVIVSTTTIGHGVLGPFIDFTKAQTKHQVMGDRVYEFINENS